MIGNVGVHRADDAQIVGEPGDMRIDLADRQSRLATVRNLNGDGRRPPVPFSVLQTGDARRAAAPGISRAGLGSKVSTCEGPPFM